MSLWDALEKAAYSGLGLAAMTKDKLDEAVEILRKERGLTEDEGRRLAEEMKDGAEEARRKLDERVEAGVEKTLKAMKLAPLKDLEALSARVSELEERLGKNNSPKD